MRRYKKYRAKPGVKTFSRLNKDAVRSADNLPQHRILRQGADHSAIPSKKLDPPSKGETARDTILERVVQGKITGVEAETISRRAKCLAPAYNKGAYQYVGSVDAASEAGRKTPKGSER